MKYTKKENEFLHKNYERYGAKYCAKILNRNSAAIYAKATRENLFYNKEEIHDDCRPIPFNQFENISTKEVAYFLGYLWADGHITTYNSNNITHWRIALEIQQSDAEKVCKIFSKIGKWSIQKRKRGNWNPTWTFVTNNKPLYLFLEKNDYCSKSTVDPTKILKLIPKSLIPFFWKGYIDGDGSLGLCGRGVYFEISSTYDYKYKEFKKALKTLNISKFNIYRSVSKRGHKSSVLKIYGKEILKLEPLFIKYGLLRKNKKFKLIKQKYHVNT